jgi:hypothetical protein
MREFTGGPPVARNQNPEVELQNGPAEAEHFENALYRPLKRFGFAKIVVAFGLYIGDRVRQADEEMKGPEGGSVYSRFSRVPFGKRRHGDF